jgi:hypothetical protein
MTDSCPYVDLIRSAIHATVFHSPVSYSWFGGNSEKLPPKVIKAMTLKTARNYLQTQLRNQLYSDLYIRGEAKPPMWGDEVSPGSEAELVESLSSANSGHGCLEGGWEVVEIQASEVAVKRNRLTLWVGLEDLGVDESGHLAVASKVRLRLPKELRNVSPGYYFALSDRSEGDGETEPLARLYWNLKPEGAPLLMRHVTEYLNKAGCYFHLKLLNNPSSYSRCDAGVLYFKSTDYQLVCEILIPIYQRMERYLKARTPAFTKALAPGVGLAEDPGRAESFGQHRCRLLADGIIRAQEEGAAQIADRLRIVSDRFSEDGIDIRQPFLGPGSTDRYTIALRTG